MAKIVIHKAAEPNPLFHFLPSDRWRRYFFCDFRLKCRMQRRLRGFFGSGRAYLHILGELKSFVLIQMHKCGI